MNLRTALDLMEGQCFPVSDAERRAAQKVIEESARSLGVAHDPAAVPAASAEHGRELRKSDG